MTPLLLNWYLNPYHTPLLVAKARGFYQEYDFDLALLEPNNPSDVTKIIGTNQISIGLKAMIHCYAARQRGYPVKAIGTLLDEPPTGLICPVDKEINTINDIVGKRIGYVGEFGKVMIDNLAKTHNIPTNAYEMKRVGMSTADAIIRGEIDAGIGLSCFQQIEVEAAGIPTHLLRIDKVANLGCCCFCSILIIVHETFLEKNTDLLSNFMRATIKGIEFTREEPDSAFQLLATMKPEQNNDTFKNIFYHTLPFFSKTGLNTVRDWNKVGNYAKQLGIYDASANADDCYTNDFIEPITL